MAGAGHFAGRQTAKGGGAILTDESKALLYSVEDSVARITLNRPEKRNALNEALVAGSRMLCGRLTTTLRSELL